MPFCRLAKGIPIKIGALTRRKTSWLKSAAASRRPNGPRQRGASDRRCANGAAAGTRSPALPCGAHRRAGARMQPPALLPALHPAPPHPPTWIARPEQKISALALRRPYAARTLTASAPHVHSLAHHRRMRSPAPACFAPSATPPACVASPPVPTRLRFNASARAPPPFGDRRSSLTAVARTRARSEP